MAERRLTRERKKHEHPARTGANTMAVAEQFITGETIRVAEEYRRKKATSVLTIVFTDIAQSTALLESLGEEAFHRLREEHEDFLRETVEFDKAGALVRCLGDGSLLVFSETSTAVERCLRIQSAM